ncbi:hypothetical protein AA0118_g7380 [Alternaria tenuissima]|nr:hypothetical protein AA0118_g7380 [Alternaria tenuissima]
MNVSERSERRRAKLRKRTARNLSPLPMTTPSRSPSPLLVPSRSPSPLVLPSPLQLELEQQAQLNIDFERLRQQSPLLYSPSHPPQLFERFPPLTEQAERSLLELQLHSTLKQLDEAGPDFVSTRLESQARDILRLLDGLPSPCPQHPDEAFAPIGVTADSSRTVAQYNRTAADGSRVVADDNRIVVDNNRVMLELNSRRPVTHAYFPATNHQSRFNTLVRKASQLCHVAEAEVYMLIRIDGRFYVFNSVDPASRVALKPNAREKVVNVAVTSGVLEYEGSGVIGDHAREE